MLPAFPLRAAAPARKPVRPRFQGARRGGCRPDIHSQGNDMTQKADRGTKRTCQSCKAHFYDLNRSEIVCPMCEAVYELAPPTPAKDTVLAAAEAKEAKEAKEAGPAKPEDAPAATKPEPAPEAVAPAAKDPAPTPVDGDSEEGDGDDDTDELIEIASVDDAEIDGSDDDDAVVFVESEEDNDTDVTVIVGGPIPKTDDEP